MLGAIVHFALRFRGVVVALACLFLAQALFTLGRAKYDVFPEFAPPQVVIQTEAPGLSPEQVEVLVTQPIENGVNGVEQIETLRSNSLQGLSVVTITFSAGSDIYRARQSITERLATIAGELPQGVPAPAITPLTSSTSVVLVLGLTSAKRSLMELRTAADWTVRQRLLAVPGVAKVAVFGGDIRQLQVQLRPDRLIKFNLSVEDVLAAARRATGVRGAGVIDTPNQRFILRSEGQSLTAAELARTVVAYHKGASLTLGEIATVTDAPAPPFGAAAVLGKPGVVLNVSEQLGANTVEVTRKLERALDDLRPALAAENISLRGDIFRPADFIQTAIGNIGFSLLLGALLVIVVLFAFLFNWRTAAISFTAIPLSLLAATSVLSALGFSLNTMTLGGFAVAIGVVVDDAIIDVENILRRLRENRARPDAASARSRVVLDASIEVRSAVVYATFIVARRLPSGAHDVRLAGPLLRAARDRLHPRRSGLARRRAHGHAGALPPALRARRSRTAEPPPGALAEGAAPRACSAFLETLAAAHHGRGRRAHPPRRFRARAVLRRRVSSRVSRRPFRRSLYDCCPALRSQESLRLGRQVSDALLEIPHIATVEQQSRTRGAGRGHAGDRTRASFTSI